MIWIVCFLKRIMAKKTKKGGPENKGSQLGRRFDVFGYGQWRRNAAGIRTTQNEDHGHPVKKPFKDDGPEGGASADAFFFPVQMGPEKFPSRRGVTLLAMKPMIRVGKRLLKVHFLTGDRRITQRKPRMT